MGICQSKGTSAKAANKKIDEVIKGDKTQAKKEVKILLLGAGESGKSTIFKQMKIIHDNGFTDEDKLEFVPTIRKHTIENFNDLLKGAVMLKLLPEGKEKEVSDILRRVESEGIDDDAVRFLTNEWNSDYFQKAFSERSKFQLADSAALFFPSLPRIMEGGYTPTYGDILACRVRTSGVSEMCFVAGGITFRMVDVGGQRNERRKWMHSFENVHAILFVVAISEYDQVLFEDEKTNRMQESLDLFQETANSKYFTNTSLILFMNKKDLFSEKIKKVDLKVCFPTYRDGCNYEPALEFLKTQFRSRCSQDLFIHVTCATSTGNIRFVFESVRETMLVQNVTGAGLL